MKSNFFSRLKIQLYLLHLERKIGFRLIAHKIFPSIDYLRALEIAISLNLMKPYLNKNTNILDIGSNWSWLIFLLPNLCNSILATDLYFDMKEMKKIWEKGQKIKFYKKNNLSFQSSIDARLLPYSDNSFDIITAISVIEHIYDDKKAFCEIFRVLKPNGIFICSIPMLSKKKVEYVDHIVYDKENRLKKQFYQRFYDMDQLRSKIFPIGFQIENLIFCIQNSINFFKIWRNIIYKKYKILSKIPKLQRILEFLFYILGLIFSILLLHPKNLKDESFNKRRIINGIITLKKT